MKKYEKYAYFEFQTTKKLPSTTLNFNRLLHMKLPTGLGQRASQMFSPLPPRLCSIHRILLFVVFITQKDDLHVHVRTTNNNIKYIKWKHVPQGHFHRSLQAKGENQSKTQKGDFKALLVIFS